ncbi:hypothetical protein SBBP1_1470004 [Burkholderiales bacterium]|nr:hypothetical protein SBBP1_1470004 [Burkholderiales bacterium]
MRAAGNGARRGQAGVDQLVEPIGEGFRIREIAPGITLDEVHASVGCKLIVPEILPTVRVVG